MAHSPGFTSRHSLSKKREPREMSGLEMQLHEQARREEHERAKRGLEALLLGRKHAVVLSAEWQESGPWYLIVLWDLNEDVDRTEEFAIWKNTGNVYRVHTGAVEDDPFIEITPFRA